MTVRRGRAAAKAPARRRSKPRAAGTVAAPQPTSLLIHPWLREAGVTVNAYTASQVGAVYGSCRLIVDRLAPAEIKATELRMNGVREDRHDDPVAWVLNYGARVDLAADAPTAQAIEESLYWSALLLGDGNGYAEIQWDGAGKLFGLWPIDPTWVEPKYDDRGIFHYLVRTPSGGEARIEAVDMFHLRGPSLRGWMGDATAVRAAKAIGIAHAAQVFSAAYFANGTVISGLLTSDKVITQAQADKARDQWIERHGGGPANQHGVSVLGQGLKYQPINHNAQESALVEQKRFQVAEIARFYGVPTTLLADNEAWTNLSEVDRGFYTGTLKSWAARFDAEATRKLYPQRQPWREVQHDLTHLTLGSFKDHVSAMTEAVNNGLWTRNEARASFGKNSVDGGDVIVVGGGVKPLDDALEPPAPPAPPAPVLPPARDDEDEDAPPMPMENEARRKMANVLRAGLALALANHRRRWLARSKDVAEDHLEAAREQLRGKLTGELAAFGEHVTAEQIADLATQVEAGVEPSKAVDHAIGDEP